MESATSTRTNTTTTTSTRRVVDPSTVDRVRGNLRAVSEGLQEVRAAARAQIEALDRLGGLVDADTMGGLFSIVETLEQRITSMEDRAQALEAQRDAAAEELESEKGRLTKLWDAYKTQEDELRAAKRDEPLLREKLADRERHISELEDQVVRLQAMETYKERYNALQRDHDRLAKSYKDLEGDLMERNDTIAQLEAKAESLKQFEEDSRRVKELERQLADEKERLAKLYKVYEDTEGKLRGAEDEAARWREWYDRHRQAFEMVGDAAHYPVKTAGN